MGFTPFAFTWLPYIAQNTVALSPLCPALHTFPSWFAADLFQALFSEAAIAIDCEPSFAS
jgi:hypothetical protein